MSRVPNVAPDTWTPPNLADVQEWVGTGELEDMLGVSRARVNQLISQPGFPAPGLRLKAGRFWRTAEVLEWAQARGREIQEDV